jgi:AraC-like DNA-binding protein
VTQRTEHLIQPSNLRPDQFARDFKQHFGVSATQVRRLASQRPTGRDG